MIREDCGLDQLINLLENPIVIDRTAFSGARYPSASQTSFVNTLAERKYACELVIARVDFSESDKDPSHFFEKVHRSFELNTLFIVDSGYEGLKETKNCNLVEDILLQNELITRREFNVLRAAGENHLHPGSMAALRIAMYLSENSNFKIIPILSANCRQFPISTLNKERYTKIWCLYPRRFMEVANENPRSR